ncbi:leiomodin-2 [Emydura macquarii macquarii]|uniref:leiomodin-2 n=1 Tax=Emydura macquarii macquarii TaxID=1129001 RepID=UPI003529E8A8
MSTFGYRRELSKYESIDEDELLASLTDEELKELERELEDIEPDRNLPVGQRQKNLTEKTPTGTFSREALMAYWEKETRKLLEKERLGACEKDSKQEDDNSEDTEEEYFTGTNSEISEEAYTEEEEEEEEEEEKEEEEENEEEESDEDDSEKKEKAEACEQIVNCESGRSSDHSKHKKFNSQKEKENVINGDGGKDTEDMSFKTGAIHPCGNPTVIEDALEKVRNNDPDTTEVNLNNIENITIQMLTHFAQALKNNTAVKMFSLANTRADDNAAIAIAGMLKVNQHITSLNIDSNFITGKGILAIMRALQHNKVLTELRFHNQRHIMGSQVEMDIAKLLKDNTNVVKLGYHFELAGPRMSMTSILTRNMDKQRQKRMQEQKQQEPGCDGAINPKTKALQKGTPGSSPYTSPKSSPWSSPKLPKKAQPVKSQPPAPPPPPPPPSPPPLPPLIVPEKKAPTRNIAEFIKQQESSKNALQNGHKKKKGKKSKKYENSILKEIKNSLKSVSDKKSEEESRPSTRPSTPQMSLHDSLMEAIRGSSMKQLKRVEVPEALR